MRGFRWYAFQPRSPASCSRPHSTQMLTIGPETRTGTFYRFFYRPDLIWPHLSTPTAA
jgi:hypothetical protein